MNIYRPCQLSLIHESSTSKEYLYGLYIDISQQPTPPPLIAILGKYITTLLFKFEVELHMLLKVLHQPSVHRQKKFHCQYFKSIQKEKSCSCATKYFYKYFYKGTAAQSPDFLYSFTSFKVSATVYKDTLAQKETLLYFLNCCSIKLISIANQQK